MSTLTNVDRRYLEALFKMSGGYVLEFTDAEFADFFKDYGIDIEDKQYHHNSGSKANRLRAFWRLEPNNKVGDVLNGLLQQVSIDEEIKDISIDQNLYSRAKQIISQLEQGNSQYQKIDVQSSEKEFFDIKFSDPRLENIPIESRFIQIIARRIGEAKSLFSSGYYLSSVIMTGSILEAVLLGVARNYPKKFNKAKSAPKTKGAVKHLNNWTLSNLIDVAAELSLLRTDVKQFSLVLRDFRNYLHPYHQLSAEFEPDEYTAKLCLQTLDAAIADLSGERPK